MARPPQNSRTTSSVLHEQEAEPVFPGFGSILPDIICQKDESGLSFTKSFTVPKYCGVSQWPDTAGGLVLDNVTGRFPGGNWETLM